MKAVDLFFKKSAKAKRERKKFFLVVAKRANEMQRELVEKTKSKSDTEKKVRPTAC